MTRTISSPSSCFTVLTEEETQQILNPFILGFILWVKLFSHTHNSSEKQSLPVSGNSKAAPGGPCVPSRCRPQCRATPACFVVARVQIVFVCVGLKSPVSVSAVLQPLYQRASLVSGREKNQPGSSWDPINRLCGPNEEAEAGTLGIWVPFRLWLFISCSVVELT